MIRSRLAQRKINMHSMHHEECSAFTSKRAVGQRDRQACWTRLCCGRREPTQPCGRWANPPRRRLPALHLAETWSLHGGFWLAQPGYFGVWKGSKPQFVEQLRRASCVRCWGQFGANEAGCERLPEQSGLRGGLLLLPVGGDLVEGVVVEAHAAEVGQRGRRRSARSVALVIRRSTSPVGCPACPHLAAINGNGLEVL